MAGKGRTFVIAGAGVAGLTLALSLAKFGASVVVLERNKQLQEFGAGLQISPNARRILDRLGAGRHLAQSAFEPKALDVYPFGAKQPVIAMQFGDAARQRFSGIPYAVMHRADLVDSLFQACKRFANIDILFGVRDFDIVEHARGLSVTVDEADGKTRRVKAFAFVGADGVHSTTRTAYVGGPFARYSGAVAWRTLIPMNAIDGVLDPQNSSLLWGPGFHAVAYPLPHRDKVNVAVFSRMARKRAIIDTPPGPIEIARRAFKDKRFGALLRAGDDSWTRWPLNAVRTPDWYKGAIGLIGDAAHAMLPFQAQGAAMAIEDAAILAPLLITEPDAETAFAGYAGLRQDRVNKVQALSARNAAIFHMHFPFSLARNLVLGTHTPTQHLDRLSWIYEYDPAPEPDIPLPKRRERAI